MAGLYNVVEIYEVDQCSVQHRSQQWVCMLCVDVVLVLLLHWWIMAFPFFVLDLDVRGVEFRRGMSSFFFCDQQRLSITSL
jgi:hypothetical protein